MSPPAKVPSRSFVHRLRGAWWRSAMLKPWQRRLLQVSALAVVVLTPALQLWGVSTARVWNAGELEARYGPLAAQASGFLRDLLGSPPDWLPGAFVGGTWSYSIGPIELADPIAVLTVLAGNEVPAAGIVLGAVVVLLLHVAMGRLFCAVLCPYGIMARLLLRLRKPLRKLGLVHDLQPPNVLRWGVLGALIAAPLVGGSLVTHALPYLAVSRALHALFWGGTGASAAIVITLLMSDLLLWDTGVCRSLCPSGALQGALGCFRLFRLQARADRACDRGCHACSESCWLGLDPRGGAPDADCDGCGRCAPVCPNNRLETMVRLPWKKSAALLFAAALVAPATADARAPEVVDGSRLEMSPFMPPADPEREVDVHFVEGDVGGRAVSVGVAEMPGDELALRVFVESAPAEPYTGPLSIEIANDDGSATVRFDAPRHPRSVPAPTLYEGRLLASLPLTVHFIDGPAAGTRWYVAGAEQSRWNLALGPVFMLGIWALLFLGRLFRPNSRAGTKPALPPQHERRPQVNHNPTDSVGPHPRCGGGCGR